MEYGVGDVVKRLAEEKGPYPHDIYEKKKTTTSNGARGHRRGAAVWDEIEPKVWLWPGYLYGNHLVHLAGASGEGKSPLTRDLIARFTSGKDWPDGAKNTHERRGVLLLSGEDDWNTDVLPHLKIAGADSSKFWRFISTQSTDGGEVDVLTRLDEDVKELQRDLEEHGDIGLIVIDPITNYLGRLNMNKEDEVRPGLLMPLADLAHKHKICSLTVGHLNKNKEGDLLDRVLGARAFAGVARQTLFCSKDPDEESRFAHIMGLGRGSKAPNLKYRTVGQKFTVNGQESEAITIEWCGKSDADIEGAVTSPMKQSDKSTNKQIQVLVKALLRDGAKHSRFVEEAIKEEGIMCVNWQRAAKGVAKSRKCTGKGATGSEWYLPTPEQAEFDK